MTGSIRINLGREGEFPELERLHELTVETREIFEAEPRSFYEREGPDLDSNPAKEAVEILEDGIAPELSDKPDSWTSLYCSLSDKIDFMRDQRHRGKYPSLHAQGAALRKAEGLEEAAYHLREVYVGRG